MSYNDYDKFKDKKKKKIYYNKEREDNSSGSLPLAKQPTILTKPDRDKESDRSDGRSQSDAPGSSSAKTALQTTFILKTRESESRAVSPSQKTPVVLRKETDAAQPSYQIATKPTSSEAPAPNPLLLPPTMTSCVKLMDDMMQMCDGAQEFLVDQNDFIVVGVLGEQGCGKSFLMSALAGRPGLFKSQVRDNSEGTGWSTLGIDMFVTSSRLVLLDTQPVLSSANLERGAQLEKKFPGEVNPGESSCELAALQMAALLLSVCHVVVVVEDFLADCELVRFLLDAEMLKPSTPTASSDDQIVEYFPNVLFLKNRATTSDFSPPELVRWQEAIRQTCEGSQLHFESGLSMLTGQLLPHLNPKSCSGSLNVFMLPLDDDDRPSDKFRGHPGFGHLVRALRHQILSVPRQSLTPSPLSEKHWFHHVSRTLDNIKKSTLFMEFGRCLP